MGGGRGGGRFIGTIGAGGALSGGGILHAAANTGIVTAAGGGRRESIQALPKAPPPIPRDRPLTRFEELALKQKLSDRETLPQYYKVPVERA